MFIPNLKVALRSRVSVDLYGRPTFAAPRTIRCGVIRLQEMSQHTSVRTDSSASRGNAMEETVLSRILVPAKVLVNQGDEIDIGDFTLTVSSVWPRYNIAGKLDHWQVDLDIAADRDTAMDLDSTP